MSVVHDVNGIPGLLGVGRFARFVGAPTFGLERRGAPHGDAGASLAGLYSLVATCEARGINPFEYLADALTRVQDRPISTIDELLPGAWAAARRFDE